MKNIMFLPVLLLICNLGEPAFSQTDKGSITQWTLAGILNGAIPSKRKDYEIKWEVIKIDASSGHMKAKLCPPKKGECFSTAEFKWSLAPNVSKVSQDDKIKVTLNIDAKPDAKCGPPADPRMSVNILLGSGGWEIPNKNPKQYFTKKIGGEFSNKSRHLFMYEGRTDDTYVHTVGKPLKSLTKTLIAKDRFGAGSNADAPDGSFFLHLYWRGHDYLVFYKYAAVK